MRSLVGCRGRLFVRPPKTLQMAFFCMQDQPCSELILPGKTQGACEGLCVLDKCALAAAGGRCNKQQWMLAAVKGTFHPANHPRVHSWQS